jgi:hypothetical protein
MTGICFYMKMGRAATYDARLVWVVDATESMNGENA